MINKLNMNLLFAGIYNSALSVLSGQMSIADWRIHAEELDIKEWKAYGLERRYELFDER